MSQRLVLHIQHPKNIIYHQAAANSPIVKSIIISNIQSYIFVNVVVLNKIEDFILLEFLSNSNFINKIFFQRKIIKIINL